MSFIVTIEKNDFPIVMGSIVAFDAETFHTGHFEVINMQYSLLKGVWVAENLIANKAMLQIDGLLIGPVRFDETIELNDPRW